MKKPAKPKAEPKKAPPPRGLTPKEQDFQSWMEDIELEEDTEPAPPPPPRPKAQ